MTHHIVTFGEIMLRLKAPRSERLFQSAFLEATFGGGEANVAVSLSIFLYMQFLSRLYPATRSARSVCPSCAEKACIHLLSPVEATSCASIISSPAPARDHRG